MSDSSKPIRLGDVEFLDIDKLPDGPTFVLPSWLDLEATQQLVALLKDRDLVFVSPEGAPHDPVLSEMLSSKRVIGFDRSRPNSERLAGDIEAAVSGGSTVVFVPEPALALPGAVAKVPAEVLKGLLQAKVQVTPLFATDASNARLEVEKEIGEPSVYAVFGKILSAGEATLPAVQQAYFDGSEKAFSRRAILGVHLGRLLIRGLQAAGAEAKIIDGFAEKEVPFHKILAAGLALAETIKKETTAERVGIVLPPGAGGLIANLAVVLAGKVPVNLNFTASREAVESAKKQAGLEKYITADPFVRKQSTFPWPPTRDLIFMERIMPSLKLRILKWLLLCKILPASAIAGKIGLPKRGGDDEATLLFTSGSSGDPKGVVLTHKNLIANVLQFSSRLSLDSDDKVVGTLPLFHSFGCTVTLWYPMIEGLSIVTYPTPLETQKIAELIHEHKATLLLGTPTFFRGYFRRVKSEQLASLRFVVAGAEKLPPRLAQAFEKKFGKRIQEGYGLTETSPVSTFNMPNPERRESDPDHTPIIPSQKLGSVGTFVNGMTLRISNPDTNEELPLNESGIISLKGANVFLGYLNDRKRTREVIKDGWFSTGDMGRVDEHGMLYIEGRLSRFSKIAGEMVPHETVEDHVLKAMGLDSDSERKIAIVGLPDDKKGELLYLLSTVASETLNQELIDLRYTLLDQGMPSLWTPKKIIPVQEIPILATGKLDIRGCEHLAKQALGLLDDDE